MVVWDEWRESRLAGCSVVQLFSCSVVQLFSCSVIQLFSYSVIQLFSYSVIQLFSYSVIRFRVWGAGRQRCGTDIIKKAPAICRGQLFDAGSC
ncbi:hypothetical protein A4R26_20185 [Niastella populi]|uniref:Uncharacterized protein n=1 Tax=Niastella populi TaxID=550983 RepID=A0A1V9FPM1_9BACT|nr:hypothetical protein A4R26_20185 [Niastella populi]